MGLIRSSLAALNNTLKDQWKEYFTCDALDNRTLVVKGKKNTKGTNRGNDNIISNGSGIVVADGQCMIIVEKGKVVEVCAEPGEFTWDNSTEPSIFTGKLSETILETFKTIGKRFTFSGDVANDQRIYYFNTKEIVDNKFGTPSPIMFRVVDSRIGLDLDVNLRCNGAYSFKIVDPILFYTNVCGNVAESYELDEIEEQLKLEFVSALQPALGKLSAMGLRPSEVANHNLELETALNEALSTKWANTRGLKVINVALASVTLPEEQQEKITNAQYYASLRDPNAAAGAIAGAQSIAMVEAAKNPNGAVNGFMGLNMAGGNQAAELFKVAQDQSWICPVCNAKASGNFCSVCGAKKPQ